MSPEEHFRRLKDDGVWERGDRDPAPAAPPATAPVRRRDRGPLWVTAIVAACLVVVSLGALRAASPAPHGVGAGAGAGAGAPGTSAASATASPTSAVRTPSPSASPTAALHAWEFDTRSRADMARARTVVACFRRHGVRIVGLVPAEGEPGIDEIGYGGPQNDQDSIEKGLRYQDECFGDGG